MIDEELIATGIGDAWCFDVECFPNYFLIGFKHVQSGKYLRFERTETAELDIPKLRWLLTRALLVGFNSIAYDVPMLAVALTGASCEMLKAASGAIVAHEGGAWALYRDLRLPEPPALNHIDLYQVDTVSGSCGHSLKTRAAQMMRETLMDMPHAHGTRATPEQIADIIAYNAIDLDVTADLFAELHKEVALREHMSREYGLDLRSKSNAQMGEAGLRVEVERVLGRRPKRGERPDSVRWTAPAWLRFEAPHLRALMDRAEQWDFEVSETGSIKLPAWLTAPVRVGRMDYTLGVGGIHSTEKSRSYRAKPDLRIIDRDVASYYPALVLSQELYPEQCGRVFLDVYRAKTEERIRCKRSGDKAGSESRKIVLNGAIGKLCSPYSFLYSPRTFLQVTLTGQLALLLLIERLEAAGIEVVSANTDGCVQICPQAMVATSEAIVSRWESDTGFHTEETRYSAIYSQDVNNYLAVKLDGSTKGKGCFANPWAADASNPGERFAKIPSNLIATEAATAFLRSRVPVETTVRACSDIRRFALCRKVTGGATYDGIEIGRIARWYWSTRSEISVLNPKGDRVAESDRSALAMTLPTELPDDLDIDRYIASAHEMIAAVGYRYCRDVPLF